MIVKRVPADRAKAKDASIRDLVDYVCGERLVDPSEKLLYANARGFLAETHAGRREEMVALAFSCPRSPEPVRHYILSWREGERPRPEQVEQAVDIFLDELGWSEHQAIYALHHNTENLHLHIVVNRVDPLTERIAEPNRRFHIEACHRAIARIEHAQGWASEANALYRVDESGEVVPRTGWRAEGERPDRPKVRRREGEQEQAAKDEGTSGRPAREEAGRKGRRIRHRPERASSRVRTRSRDAERWTGEKSAERVAIERAAPVLRAARSWAELHERLAGLGFRYQRVGSGAVLWVGEVAVKASAVDRAASLKRMEARLGPYEPAAEELAIAPLASEPLVSAMTESAAYVAARREHFARKQAAKAALDRRHAEERRALRARQRAERERLFGRDWAGLGLLRVALTKVLAGDQAEERRALRARQREERAAWRREFPPFPDIETWLRERHGAELAWVWRYQERLGLRADRPLSAPSLLAVRGGEGEVVPYDIAGFRALRVGRAVHYLRAENRALAFVDHGQRIDVPAWEEEDALLAALRLAALKWGSFTVEGSEAFKAACVRLAAEHGFDLANPELASALAAERARVAAERKHKAEGLAEAIPRGVGASAAVHGDRVAAEARAAGRERQPVGGEAGLAVPGPEGAERQQSPPLAGVALGEDGSGVPAGRGVDDWTRAIPNAAQARRVWPGAAAVASDKTAPKAEDEGAARGEEADRTPVSPLGAAIPAGAAASSAGTPRPSAEPAAAAGSSAEASHGPAPGSTAKPDAALSSDRGRAADRFADETDRPAVAASSGTAPGVAGPGAGRGPPSPAARAAEPTAEASAEPDRQAIAAESRVGAGAPAAKAEKQPPAPYPQPERAQTPEPEPPECEEPALEEDEDDTPDPWASRRRPGW